MKRPLLFAFFALSTLVFLSLNVACNVVHGSGVMAKEKRDVTGFTAIDAGGAMDLEVSQSDTYSVEVQADKNMIHRVLTSVENGTLKIEMSTGDFDFLDNPNVHVKVSLPKISALGLAGASSGIAKNIKSDKLNLEISGASKMIISGTATELISEVSGASKAIVHANTSLKIDAAGASKVIYSGSAKVTQESSGASSVSQE